MVWLQKVHMFQDGATNYATTLVEHPIFKKSKCNINQKTSFSHRSSKIPKIPREDRKFWTLLIKAFSKRYLWVQTPDPHHPGHPLEEVETEPGPLLQEPRCCCVHRKSVA